MNLNGKLRKKLGGHGPPSPPPFRIATATIVSRKYAYADDLAIMHADGGWQAVEGVLSKNMTTVGEYPKPVLIHSYCDTSSQYLQAKAQHYKKGVSILPS